VARFDRHFRVAIAVLLFASPLAAQQAPKSVTLAQALAMAEEASPQVLSARGSVRTAELGIRTAILAFIPSLSLTPQASLALSSGQSRLDPVTGEVISGNTSTKSFGLNLSGSLTLFDGFARNNSLKSARAQLNSADAALTSQRFAIAQTTTSAYLDALQNQLLLKVSEGAVQAAEQQLRAATARLQTGAGQRTDSLNFAVTLGQSRLNLLNAQANLATSEANLGRYIGVSGRVAATDDSSFSTSPAMVDTTQLRAMAQTSSPAVKTAEASLISAQASYRSSKAGYWPTVSLSAGSNWTGQSTNDYKVIGRRSLNLSFSMSPWTSLSRETQIEQRSIAVTNAEANLADLKLSLDAQMTQYLATLANAQQQFEVSRASVAAATENLRVTNERFRLGVATIIEAINAQQSLTQAQVNEIQARFSYLRTKTQLESILGRKL
jgi:outer membrane protein